MTCTILSYQVIFTFSFAHSAVSFRALTKASIFANGHDSASSELGDMGGG